MYIHVESGANHIVSTVTVYVDTHTSMPKRKALAGRHLEFCLLFCSIHLSTKKHSPLGQLFLA